MAIVYLGVPDQQLFVNMCLCVACVDSSALYPLSESGIPRTYFHLWMYYDAPVVHFSYDPYIAYFFVFLRMCVRWCPYRIKSHRMSCTYHHGLTFLIVIAFIIIVLSTIDFHIGSICGVETRYIATTMVIVLLVYMYGRLRHLELRLRELGDYREVRDAGSEDPVTVEHK